MASKIRVFALGGLDENGKCMLVVEIKNDIFIIEAGLKYPDSTNPGIDAIIPNFDYLKQNRSRVKAYIITHGHDDQMGSLPYMYKQVQAPIYASRSTIALLKQFTSNLKMSVNYEFVTVNPTSAFDIAGHHFELFQTAHSVMESFGFSISTEYGSIVYSGDFIIEYNTSKSYKHDLHAVAKIAEKETLLLITESSGADKPGYTSPNHRLAPHLALPFQEAKNRIFIALYNQSVYNLEEALRFAFDQGKKVVFYDKDTEEYIRTFQELGTIYLPKDKIILRENHLRVPQADLVVLMMGPGEKIYKKIAELGAGVNEDKTFVVGPADTFIVACPSAPAIEILATNAVDDLYRSGAKVVNIKRKHVSSMHAQEEDIKTMLSLLRPKYFMPFKGEYVQLVANAKLAVAMNIGLNHNNTFLMDNGMVLEFPEGKGKVLSSELDQIPHGDLLIDGLGVGDVRKDVILERQKLSDDGVIVMGITVSKADRKIVAGPDIQMRGFVFVKDSENVLKELVAIYTATVQEYLDKKSMGLEEVKNQVIDKALRFIKRETGKKPLVMPIIVNLD